MTRLKTRRQGDKETRRAKARQLVLFPDFKLPVEGRKAKNPNTKARIEARGRWQQFKRAQESERDLSFPEFLKRLKRGEIL